MRVEEIPFSELLSEVVDNRGRTCPTAETGIPLIATNCIRNELLYPTYDKVRFVSQATYDAWFRGHPKPGDIIFVNKATPGRVCLVPDPVDFCIAQDMVAVRANPKRVYPKFLLAVLRSTGVQEKIGQMHVGTLIPHFKKGDFDKLLLPIPSRKEQEFIGDTYFELSAKIELNRRMNVTLEATARALFQSWFVDFDPVRANLDGRPSAGFDPATAALFPSSFERQGDGVVPKGWKTQRWGDISTLEYGKSLRGYKASGGRYRVFGTNGAIGFHNESLCKSAGIVIGRKGAYRGVHYSPEPFFVIDTAFYLKPKSPLDLKWAYYELLRFDINGMDSGSAIPSTSRDDFYGIPLICPPLQIQNAFGEIVGSLFARTSRNQQQSSTLANLRDTLLPKLLSGELSVAACPRTSGGSV